MPVLIDWMNNEVIGPRYRQAMEEGRQSGLQEGEEKGERRLVARQIRKRFGPLPKWARTTLESMSIDELERTGLRMLDVETLDQLFG